MIFVTIEKDFQTGKDHIRFCSDKECILMELVDRHLISCPFPGGRIPDDCLPDLISFFQDNTKCT